MENYGTGKGDNDDNDQSSQKAIESGFYLTSVGPQGAGTTAFQSGNTSSNLC